MAHIYDATAPRSCFWGNSIDTSSSLESALLARGSRTWAVVIGVDDYICAPPLQGATKDALAVRDYLVDSLRVPQDHIRLLLNRAATRQGILDTLYQHLRDNRRIHFGDTIVIHYSGHGTTYPFPTSRNPLDEVEAILPVDRGTHDAHSDDIVDDISDRELQLFLSELRDAKGDNITFIMDCCFSGGGIHCPHSQVRFGPPLPGRTYAMLDAAEQNPRRRWPDGSALTDQWRADMSSHVVLTACRDDEVAEDGPEGGAFTSALIRTLRQVPIYKTTYVGLSRSIPQLSYHLSQTPVLAGMNRNEVVFMIGCTMKFTPRLLVAQPLQKLSLVY